MSLNRLSQFAIPLSEFLFRAINSTSDDDQGTDQGFRFLWLMNPFLFI